MKTEAPSRGVTRIWPFLLSAAVVSGGMLVLLISPWGQFLEENLGLDALFILRGQRAPPQQVVIVAIDEYSAEALGLPDAMPEWPRTLYARLVRGLHEREARAIAFDVFFKEPGEPAADREFATALRQADNTILFAFTERRIAPMGGAHALLDQLREPMPLLREAAAATAPFVLPKASSKVTRYWPRWDGQPPRWTLPTAALRVAHGDDTPLLSTLAGREAMPVYNFYGPPRTFLTLPLQELLNDETNFARIPRGATVFVGYSAQFQPGQIDGFYTPFTGSSGLDISGVELAATAYANIDDGSVIHYQLSVWVLALVLYSALQCLMGLLLPLRYSVPLAGALAASYGGLALWLFTQHAYWLPWMILLLLLTPMLVLLCAWYRVALVRGQKQRLEVAFAHYLPAAEIGRLASSTSRLSERESLFGLCLVTDARNYTALAERMSPLQLASVLESYYAAVLSPIQQHGGIISDVAGDGVIALWPNLEPEHVWDTLAPVLSALRDSVADYNRMSPQNALPTRVGAHAGEVVLGHFGASRHYEFRAVGDLVNTTSRIENANKILGTQTLFSHRCINGQTGSVRYLGRFRMQGKRQPLPLYTSPEDSWGKTLENRWREALRLLDADRIPEALGIIEQLHDSTGDRVCQLYLRKCNEQPGRGIETNGVGFFIDLPKSGTED